MRASALAFAGLLAGCAASPVPDAGPDAPLADAPPLRCDRPDVVCPLAPAWPPLGGLCVGELRCAYVRSDSSMFDAVCVAGRWAIELTCPPGSGCLPPLVEECEAPFAGTLAGATVEIGPADAERPYEDGERVPVVYGPQGLPMFPFAVRLRGLETPPPCVEYTLDMAFASGITRTSSARTMTLYCGGSRTAFWNPPELECDEIGVTLTLRVAGIGEARASIVSVGGRRDCP